MSKFVLGYREFTQENRYTLLGQNFIPLLDFFSVKLFTTASRLERGPYNFLIWTIISLF